MGGVHVSWSWGLGLSLLLYRGLAVVDSTVVVHIEGEGLVAEILGGGHFVFEC
jgi:hypothetical protein